MTFKPFTMGVDIHTIEELADIAKLLKKWKRKPIPQGPPDPEGPGGDPPPGP